LHDWLFTSGGIGPTRDNVTVFGVAKAFGVRVVEDPMLADLLRKNDEAHRTNDHPRSALVPEGATPESTDEVHWHDAGQNSERADAAKSSLLSLFPPGEPQQIE
jgi:molybdopterin-biosynthesis enzyme MoeA-like protein